MIYEKDKEYEITYVNNNGEEITKNITPEKDMNVPEMILMLKEQDEDFFKLLTDISGTNVEVELKNTDEN